MAPVKEVAERPVLEAVVEESQSSRLSRKTKEAPFFAIGLTGCVAAVLFGAYKYKTRGQMSTSVYLMQLRVIAQGTVVGACTVGVIYSLYKQITHKSTDTSEL